MTTILDHIAARQRSLDAARAKDGSTFAAYRRLAYPLHRKDALGYSDPDAGIVLLPNGEPQVDDVRMASTFVVSRLVQDRDGDVVEPMGFRLENYKINPLWFFGHQMWEIPIGTAEDPQTKQLSVYLQPDRVMATCFYDAGDPDAVFIYGKVRRGILRMTSIGFMPLEAERIAAHEGKAAPDRNVSEGLYPGWHFKAIDLLEISIVGVPSNPLAMNVDPKEVRHLSVGMCKALESCRGKACSVVGGWEPETETMSKKWRKAKPPAKQSKGDSITGGVLSEGGALVPDTYEEQRKTDADKPRDAGTDVQLVRVPKSLCPTAADAKSWLETHEFDPSHLAEQDDHWEAVQFSPDGCTPDSSSEVELKDGVTAVVCQSKTVEAPEAEDQTTNTGKKTLELSSGLLLMDNGDGTFTRLVKQEDGTFKLAKRCGCHDNKKHSPTEQSEGDMKTKAKKITKADDLEQSTSGHEEPVPVEDPQEEEQENNLPHGAQVAHELVEHFAACQHYLEDMLPQMDPTPFKDYLASKFGEALTALVGELRDTADEVYPDVGFADEAETKAEDSEDEEAGESEEKSEAEEMDDDAEQPEEKEEESANNIMGSEGELKDEESEEEASGAGNSDAKDGREDLDDLEDKKKRATILARYRKGNNKKTAKQSAVVAKRYMNKAARMKVKEAADHLEAAADHDYGEMDEKGHKVMCSAHRYHAKELRELADMDMDDHKAEPPPMVPQNDTGHDDMDDETTKQLREELSGLRRMVRLATGRVD